MAVSKLKGKNKRSKIIFIALGAIAALLLVWLAYNKSNDTEIDIDSWQRQSLSALGISAAFPPGTTGNDTPNGSQPAVAGLELDANYRLEVRDISGSTSGQLEVDQVATVKLNGVTRYILARDVGERGKTTAVYLSDCAQTPCGITQPTTGKRVEATLWKEVESRSGSGNPADYFSVSESGARQGIEVLKSVQFK